MSKWITTVTAVVLAVGCARNAAHAQAQDRPEPAPPAQAAAEQDREAQRAAAEEAAAAARNQAAEQRDRATQLQAELRAAAAAGRAGRAQVFSRAVKKEPAAWLGVVTSPVSGALRKQTRLTHKGIGLVVERVERDSPAAEAGLEQYDIIEKLNDQWLVNSQQFGVLIRMHKAGDQVTLTVIRGGEPQQLTATLVEKELPVLSESGSGALFLGQAPGEAAGMFEFPHSGIAQFDFEMPKLSLEGSSLLDLETTGDTTITVTDDQYTYKLTQKDGKRTLDVTEDDGESVFSGPVDTDEQREAIPQDVRENLQKFKGLPNVVKLRKVEQPTPPAPVPAPAPVAPPAQPARDEDR